MITPAQIRAARALIGWTQAQLATAAKKSTPSLGKIENGVSDPRASTIKSIKQILEKEGVVFISADEMGEGVRLKTRE